MRTYKDLRGQMRTDEDVQGRRKTDKNRGGQAEVLPPAGLGLKGQWN